MMRGCDYSIFSQLRILGAHKFGCCKMTGYFKWVRIVVTTSMKVFTTFVIVVTPLVIAVTPICNNSFSVGFLKL